MAAVAPVRVEGRIPRGGGVMSEGWGSPDPGYNYAELQWRLAFSVSLLAF